MAFTAPIFVVAFLPTSQGRQGIVTKLKIMCIFGLI